jgi:hypothetical protein
MEDAERFLIWSWPTSMGLSTETWAKVVDRSGEHGAGCKPAGAGSSNLSGANTVEVIEAVKAKLTRSRAMLPSDVSVDVIQDQSRYISAAMREIQGHLIAGRSWPAWSCCCSCDRGGRLYRGGGNFGSIVATLPMRADLR